MAKVINFNTRESRTSSGTPDNAPNPAIIEALKELLELAEGGELRAIVISGLLLDGNVVDAWYDEPDNPQPYLLLGALEALKQDFCMVSFDHR